MSVFAVTSHPAEMDFRAVAGLLWIAAQKRAMGNDEHASRLYRVALKRMWAVVFVRLKALKSGISR